MRLMIAMQDELFHLKVSSKEGTLYEDSVSSITSFNEKGRFDVLGQHANFISLITKALTIRKKEGEAKEIKFDYALMRVISNNVEVYVGLQGLGPSSSIGSDFSVNTVEETKK